MEGEGGSRGSGWLRPCGEEAAAPRKGPETQGFLCCFNKITLDSSEMFAYTILNDTIHISNA